ncbi:hypothetical protein GG681_10995 [Epibacterium sp. SM1969]|uniref:Uncharacterized protein n=1 Tax=Tritonibacter aquimaris TaxID=2663379 RepID=A0A844ATP6_9RHOB|nr:hypothetical protein [Tritonibacter aquimaris]MQY43167.1 hypothetical protein [Tritonibacter aquimaris]
MSASHTEPKAPNEPIATLRSLVAVIILLGVMFGSTVLAEVFDSDFPTYFGTAAMCLLPIAALCLLYFGFELAFFRIALWLTRRRG